MRQLIFIVFTMSAAACGSTSTAPSTVTAPTVVATPAAPTVSVMTLTGRLTATNGGQPLPGVSATLSTVSTVTDGNGTFSAAFAPVSSAVLSLSGAAIVPRRLTLAALTSRSLNVGAIALSNGFDLAFYRQLARNGYDEPGALQLVRRWTRTPQIYLKTVDEAGEAIHPPTLDIIEAAAKDAVPRWTSGALGVPTVTRGTETREGVSGWITIKFPTLNTVTAGGGGVCGRAQVGVEGGWIELNYHSPAVDGVTCRVAGAVIAPHVVEHEMGHALGFWHTDTEGDLMYTRGSWFSRTGLPTARELAHAAIVYARPVGNADPDSDPLGTVNLAPMSVR